MVLGIDLQRAGLVEEVHPTGLLLDREWQHELDVPLRLVDRVANRLVILSIIADPVNTRA